MSKYCEKCGCYLPIGEEKCPACGYNKKAERKPDRFLEATYKEIDRLGQARIFDSASNSFIYKPEDCVNVANKPEVIKARIESEVNVYGKLHQCPYGWGCMVPACAKCNYCDVNASPTLVDNETRYTFRCEKVSGRTWSFVSSKDPRFDDEVPCPKFHMDNDCSYCPIAHCEIAETDDGDRNHYKNFTKTYTCPHMENENIVKKVICRCI